LWHLSRISARQPEFWEIGVNHEAQDDGFAVIFLLFYGRSLFPGMAETKPIRSKQTKFGFFARFALLSRK
jgi:hypothetical protein